MNGLAFAQSGGAGGGIFNMLGPLTPIILLFLIFYFLLIRPQQKKVRAHQTLVQNLKRDDYVLTQGGICGRITGLTDQFVTVEIADKVRVKIARNFITNIINDPAKGLQVNE